MKTRKRHSWQAFCAAMVGLFLVSAAHAGDTRARTDYKIHCQGCHVQDGSGFPGKVPDLRTSLPLLLSVEGGRAFLVQVPGSAQSALPDARLADTLNWMVATFADAATAASVSRFTDEEVAGFRAARLRDVGGTRSALIGHLEGQDGRKTE